MNTLDDELVELATHLDAEMRIRDMDIVLQPRRHHARGRRHIFGSVAAASMLIAAGVTGLAIYARGDSTTPAADTAPSATIQQPSIPAPTGSLPLPSCAEGAAQVALPNVAGLPYGDAADSLTRLGLTPEPLFELTPWGTTTDADPVVNQRTAPGSTVSCGAAIELVVAFNPGPLHVVQPGDTLASVAEAAGLTTDQLVAFNGVETDAELKVGLAVRLTAQPGPPPETS